MNKIIFAFLCFLFLLVSCNSLRNSMLVVASEQADCVGVIPQKCYLIKSEGDADWKYFYSQIEGFTYEPGYEYVLEVKIEKKERPAAGQSSIKYILVKEISKVQKVSNNLKP